VATLRCFALLISLGPAAAQHGEVCANDRFISLIAEGAAGWTNGIRVQNGVLTGRGWYHRRRYSDFHFKFDFKLYEGSNSGIGLRTPIEAHPAYDGMEIQVLDDTASRYKDLQPWQYHGSVYGVAPATRGHLKPVGEWNSEEIIARGHHIIVILNGTTIVDVNLAEVAKVIGHGVAALSRAVSRSHLMHSL
jgi:hypothetical protein